MAKKKDVPVKKAATKTTRTTNVKTAVKKTKVAAKKTTAKPAAKKVAKTVKPAKKAVAKAAPKKAAKTAVKTSAKATKPKTTKPAIASVAKTPTKPAKIKDSTELLADAIVEGILEIKGKNISVLDLRDIHNRVCDYFIICQADSSTQVNAIANSVEVMVKKRTGERPYRKEGFENSEWILVDYVNVVVHVFQTEVRNFYNLESLWADAHVTEIAFD
ncbi:MAG TPA: ribosome silencing factor [Bacteroidia bacterium]|jgi:ribosome-associated protein